LVSRRNPESDKVMGSLGMQEIIVIFVIALIVFGPRKLPELGKSLGRGLAEFKRASNELKQTWEEEVRLDKEKEEFKKATDELKRSWDEEIDKEKEEFREVSDDLKKTIEEEKPSDTEKEPKSEIYSD
jgi:sec-independent protein translocase protein TatA